MTTDEVRRPRHRRRARRHRGGARGRADGPPTALLTAVARRDRPDVLQPGDRRPREGAARARDRRARRAHGTPRRRAPASSSRCSTARAGPAVWGPRAQCDRALYARLAREALAETREPDAPRRHGRRASSKSGGRVAGVVHGGRATRIGRGRRRRDDGHVPARPHAHRRAPARRAAASASRRRRASPPRSRALGLRARPVQDGHAAARPSRHRRLRRCAVRSSGDDPPVPFSSARASDCAREQVLCWLTSTNEGVHALIRENLHREPDVLGRDPGHRAALLPVRRRQGRALRGEAVAPLFLEPEGVDARRDLRQRALDVAAGGGPARDPRARFPALARARMLRPGYAVEYDFVFPDQLAPTLEALRRARALPRRPDQRHLRIRGGGGAGALGRESTRRSPSRGEEPFVLERSEAYAAVHGRRPDDAGARRAVPPLHVARRAPAAPRCRLRAAAAPAARAPPRARLATRSTTAAMRRGGAARARRAGASTAAPSIRTARRGSGSSETLGIDVDAPTTVRKLLKRNDLSVDAVAPACAGALSRALAATSGRSLESRVRYEGYIRRERERLERLRPLEAREIPDGFDYRGDPGPLARDRREVRAAAGRGRSERPSRIPGVTPAAVAIISAHVARGGRSAA